MRYHSLVAGLAGLLMVLGLISGCSDDPSHQADMQMQEKTAAAIDSLVNKRDVEQARRQLDSALAIRGSAESRDSALLTSGDLEYTEAGRQVSDLELMTLPAQRVLIAAQGQIRRILKLQVEQQRTQQLIDSGDQEIQELKQVLAGDGNVLPGLHNELAEAKRKMQQLEQQKQQWQQKENEADNQLQALQTRADEQLEQSRQAPAAQQAAMEQAGYQTLMQKKDSYFDKQEAVTQLDALDKQIALVSPVIERLTAYIQETEQKITGLENSQELVMLRAQRQALAADIGTEQATLRDQLSAFKKEVAGYRSACELALASLDKVAGIYDKVQSRSSRPTVLYKKAQTQSLTASVYASRLLFESHISLAVEGMINSAGEDAALRSLLQDGMVTVAEDQLLAKAVELYDAADKTFEQALSEGRSLGPDNSKQYILNVTKSRLLNMHAKMKLADSLDRYELAEKTQATLDELRQKAAADLGPAYTQSETARLLEKGLNYVPKMPFDSELFFEAIRPNITAWRQVQGTPAQREAAARQALQQIQQIEAEADEKLLRLLQPEKQALESAIANGFTEETPAAPRSRTTEPNNF